MYMTNNEIYNKWCELQKVNNRPAPEYPLEAYTQETIDMWKRILGSEPPKVIDSHPMGLR